MERSHLYGVIKKEIIRTLRRLKSVLGSDYTRLAQKTRLSAGCALDSFVGGKGVCPFPTSHFVLVRHGKKCNCKHAFFAHVGRAPYFEAKPLMRRGGESLLQARLSCSRRAWEFTILSGSPSAPAQKKGAPKCSLALAQKTRFELVLPVKVLLP